MLRETHAASDRKQNRTAGLQGGGELRPKTTCRPSRHIVFRAGRGAHCTQKRGLDLPVRPQARGN